MVGVRFAEVAIQEMTDRFYPLGKASAEDVWKTSYEIQNEMRSFQRSAYPPGYAGHEPGSREKFGFSTPGPNAARLAHSHLALREEPDVAELRRMHAVPRMQVTDERKTFRDLDVPEMDRSYKSAILSPMYRSMAKSRTLPNLQPKAAPPRLGQLPAPKAKLDDGHFSYFVPKALNREAEDQLMARSLPKLYNQSERKVALPFSGDGTGFRTQSSQTEWWPSASRVHDEPTSYAASFQRPSFYRMSPTVGAPSRPRAGSKCSSVRSLSFIPPEQPDGNGSIRLGTPTLEDRRSSKDIRFTAPAMDSGFMQRTSPLPVIKPTPAARFGYMPPGAGRLQRSDSKPIVDQGVLSDALVAKIVRLYHAMDRSGCGVITRADAGAHFRKFGQVSAGAMFNEVDDDSNGEITLQEFVDFWEQVKRSHYSEEDLDYEMQELLEGNVWVDYKDERDVGGMKESVSKLSNL